jgi:cob(I)alamin adenosyltransferase
MAKGQGLIHIYTGEGKGKTTAALGLAIRAAGQGLRVLIIQFMKEAVKSGEAKFLKGQKQIQLFAFGQSWVSQREATKQQLAASLQPGYELALKELQQNNYDLIILDELITACSLGLLAESKVVKLLKAKQPQIEVVLTGRGATPKLIALADLVTEMKLIKHPYEKGIKARKGVEY